MENLSARLQRTSPSLQGAGNGPKIPKGPLSSTDIKIPYIEADVITHLKHVFQPHVAPDYTLRQYDRQVGHTQVIEYLERLYREQETT
jgi:hypothetical protein